MWTRGGRSIERSRATRSCTAARALRRIEHRDPAAQGVEVLDEHGQRALVLRDGRAVGARSRHSTTTSGMTSIARARVYITVWRDLILILVEATVGESQPSCAATSSVRLTFRPARRCCPTAPGDARAVVPTRNGRRSVAAATHGCMRAGPVGRPPVHRPQPHVGAHDQVAPAVRSTVPTRPLQRRSGSCRSSASRNPSERRVDEVEGGVARRARARPARSVIGRRETAHPAKAAASNRSRRSVDRAVVDEASPSQSLASARAASRGPPAAYACDVETGHDDRDGGGAHRPIVPLADLVLTQPGRTSRDGCRDAAVTRHPAAGADQCGKVNRTAVWATSAGMPIARRTCEGSSLPAAHADPLDDTKPRRSSSAAPPPRWCPRT